MRPGQAKRRRLRGCSRSGSRWRHGRVVRLETVHAVVLAIVNMVMDRVVVTTRGLTGGFLRNGDRRNRYASRERYAPSSD
jgi:hypothetical protein